MPPETPPDLPPRLRERLEALPWPASFGEADAEFGIRREWLTIAGTRQRFASYRTAHDPWPLGEAIIDAILDTVGPHAAALARRRVVVIPPAKGHAARDEIVRVRRVPRPINDATGVDLLWAVDPVGARALLWPTTTERFGPDGERLPDRPTPAEIVEGRMRLVHLVDWSCSVITENGAVERTTLREPSALVARWGRAMTPAAHALVEYGRGLPREQLTLDDGGGS
jgi:hypothetical protein